MPRSFTPLLCILLLAGILCGLFVATAQAQEQQPRSQHEAVRTLGSVARQHLSALDNTTLRAQYPRQGPGPLRFAEPRPTALRVDQAGTWEQLDDGTLLWRLRVRSENARSLNLGFTEYHLPPGAEIFLYTPDQETVIGPFTAEDNAAHGELWTPVIPGDEVVIEATVPTAQKAALRLTLGQVNHGFRSLRPAAKSSGACNIDVACEEADDWREEIRSVGRYTTSSGILCTGVLINNTAENWRPYFLTADHCDITPKNAASVVVYWNFDHSECRPPSEDGGRGNGVLDQFNTGAIHHASYSGPSFGIHGGPDVTLIELDEPIDPAYDVHFAGWNRTDKTPLESVTIHHPQGQEKRISFDLDPATITSYLEPTVTDAPTHLRIADWDIGTTEPGSSGAPLFNANKQVVGVLSGGYAACYNNEPDWYGRFSVAWDATGTAGLGLRNRLDPFGTAATMIAGINLEEDDTRPAPITDLRIRDVENDRITLTWTATGDDGTSGIATYYDLRFSQSPITDLDDFRSATTVSGLPVPESSGTLEALTIPMDSLQTDTPYYFALVARDKVGNTSPLTTTTNNAIILEDRFTLQAYPNPFRTTTTVGFAVQEPQRVRADLYDALGRRVQHLYDDTLPANILQELRIDASPLASGVYFVRLVGEDFARTLQVVRAR